MVSSWTAECSCVLAGVEDGDKRRRRCGESEEGGRQRGERERLVKGATCIRLIRHFYKPGKPNHQAALFFVNCKRIFALTRWLLRCVKEEEDDDKTGILVKEEEQKEGRIFDDDGGGEKEAGILFNKII